MAFKMKGHTLPGPYQQKKEIDASAPEYNQPVDNENTKRVMDMRGNQSKKAEEAYKGASQTQSDYIDQVNQAAKEMGGLDESQVAAVNKKDAANVQAKNKAYDAWSGKIDAHNFSADSANTAIENQNKRQMDASKKHESLFKQTSKDRRDKGEPVDPKTGKVVGSVRMKKGLKPSKVKDSDKVTGTRTSKTGKKSVIKKGDKKPGGLKASPAKMKKKSPMKIAPIVAKLAPKVIGAVAGNMMSKKEE